MMEVLITERVNTLTPSLAMLVLLDRERGHQVLDLHPRPGHPRIEVVALLLALPLTLLRTPW